MRYNDAEIEETNGNWKSKASNDFDPEIIKEWGTCLIVIYVYENGKDASKAHDGSRKGNDMDENLQIFLNVTFNYIKTGKNIWMTDLLKTCLINHEGMALLVKTLLMLLLVMADQQTEGHKQ